MEEAKKKLKVEETGEKPAKYKQSKIKIEAASTSANVSSLDRLVHSWTSRFTLGISPASLMLAYLDWLVHLTFSPGKQAELVEKAVRKALRFNLYAARSAFDPAIPCCIEPLPQDQRFSSVEWRCRPFNLIYQSFLLTQ